MMIVVQAVLLALSALFIPKIGAMSVGAVGGLLTALISGAALGPFTFFFAFLFGVFVDVFLFIFKVKGSPQGISRNRLMAAMAVSTLLIAFSSYLAFTMGFFYISLLVQRSPMLDALVLFMGPATGAVAGYAASYLWNKYLRYISI
jgi:ABC-type thiamin/hydroxymethylpyrimidine transport system permease subunit